MPIDNNEITRFVCTTRPNTRLTQGESYGGELTPVPPSYKPLPDYLTIRESPIAGLGLFATKFIPNESYIGIIHVLNNDFPDGVIRTPLGGFGNHSDTPNTIKVSNIPTADKTWICACKDILPDEEVTWKYTLYKI